MLSVVLVFFMTFLASSSAATNNDTIYCEKDLCPSGYQPHIACGHSGEFSSTCPTDRRLINLTNENIKKFLNEHNNYRNIVASGKQTGLKSAASMKTLVRKFTNLKTTLYVYNWNLVRFGIMNLHILQSLMLCNVKWLMMFVDQQQNLNMQVKIWES
jgi:hypothetical protein